MPIHNVILRCKKCGHRKNVERVWAAEKFGIDQYASVEDIQVQVLRQCDRIRCSECGAKGPEVRLNESPVEVPKPLQESEKRFVDEGFPGSREDHKKMRTRQWVRTKEPKF